MKLRGLPAVVLGTITLLVFVPKVLATFSFQLDSLSSTSVTTKDQELTANISLSDLPSESYFSVAFQKGSGSYFGYIKDNSNNWVKVESSTDCNLYYHVTDTSITNLQLTFKVGDDNSPTPGDFHVTAHRYTTGCSKTTSNDIPVTFEFLPTPTPTTEPTPTEVPPTPTPDPSPTPTEIPPTPTLEPTPTSTPEPTLTPTTEPTPTPTEEPSPTPTTEPTPTTLPTPTDVPPAPTPNPTGSPVPPSQVFSTPILTCTVSYRPVTIFGLLFYFPKLSCTK